MVTYTYQFHCVLRQLEVFTDVDTNELITDHSLYLSFSDQQWLIDMLIPPPVHNHLLGLTDVKCEVISLTPCDQFQHFLLVSSLIFACDKTNDCGVICKFYDDIVGLGSDTVKRENSVQYGAEYTALRSARVHYAGAGGVFSSANTLWSTVRKLQYPVTQIRRQPQVMQLGYQF